jgi:hypothetical protein
MSHLRTKKVIFQFVVTLEGTNPAIYRRIEVPKTYTFWDLHVAIQDAFGWWDSHLHEFSFPRKKGKEGVRIGIPIDDGFMAPEDLPEAGWEIGINEFFSELGDEMLYLYDFGDHWMHSIVLEGMLLAPKRVKYPRCTEGALLAPPEDCGGIGGYYNLLDVIANPKDPEYKEMLTWVKGMSGRKEYCPESFDSSTVKFTNSQKRLRDLLEEFEEDG